MTPGTPQDHISKKRVLYTVPEMSGVIVRRDQEYARSDSGPLTIDLYCPPGGGDGAPAPAVLFVTGFPDPGAQKIFGCRLKDMGSYTSWAQLAAASGLAAVTYTNNEPAADVHSVLQYLRRSGAELGIDAHRIGLWACSGNAPTALSLLMLQPRALKCAVLCYPYLLDLDNTTAVADAARQFRFVNACATKSIEDLPRDMPLFIVRAGQDQMPGLNDALDRFMAKALALNLPITFVNHSAAPHAFDLFFDNKSSRDIIACILQFMRCRLEA
jgi:dienelactone hydrolase